MTIYTHAIYFVTETVTTVGYGDISPRNEKEKSFMIFMELLGILLFSYISTNIESLKFK